MLTAQGSPEDAVGAVLNQRFKLLRLVGEGGLAAVYEAHEAATGATYAIKLLHPQFRQEEAIVQRFYAEAKACFSLRHPHITNVKAYDYAEDGTPYIVMELLHGCPLDEYLMVNKSMTVEQAGPILYGVLQALSVAHGAGIVHRDLKPQNLFLVSEPTGQYAVKVLDFGIAKVMDAAGGMGSKTQTGAVLGTPGYMSPEQIMNAKQGDPRTDLWAAGVVFYEMLTSHHPFGPDNLSRILTILKDPHTPISEHRPELAHWEPFFERCLVRDLASRFESAEQMIEALRELAQGTPARFVPDGLQTVAIPLLPTRQAPQHGSVPSPVSPGYPPVSPGYPPVSPGYPAVGITPHGAGGTPVPSSPPVASGTQIMASVPPGPAGQPGPTQVSGQVVSGPSGPGRSIPVYAAADIEPLSTPWWATLLIALVAFGAGMFCGYVIANS